MSLLFFFFFVKIRNPKERLFGMEIWSQIIGNYLENNETVSEIECNGTRSLFFRSNGKRYEMKNFFPSVEVYTDSILELVQKIRPHATEVQPFLEEGTLYLKNGGIARVHITTPPSCLFPMITIARKTATLTTLEDLNLSGSMNGRMLNFIKACIYTRLTLVFSGGTGSGKPLHEETLIPTTEGIKKAKDVKMGDFLFDEVGQKAEVLSVFRPKVEKAYRVKFSHSEDIIAGSEHLWEVHDRERDQIVSSIEEYLDKSPRKYCFLERVIDEKELEDFSKLAKNKKQKNMFLTALYTYFNMFGQEFIYLDPFLSILREPEVLSTENLKYRLKKPSDSPSPRFYVYSVPPLDLKKDPYAPDILFKNQKSKEDAENFLLSRDENRILKDKNLFPAFPEEYHVSQEEKELWELFFSSHGIFFREEEDEKTSSVIFKFTAKDQNSRLDIHELLSIEDTSSYPDEFVCFTVDSPASTFCCGRSFVLTHNTTMLEAATKLWPNNVRIGVVEDAPELKLIQPNVVYLKSSVRRPGIPEDDVATLDWCVAQLNRQRVDLIIIGETRGKEFASFLTAANSGCEGSMTTIHAANPRMCLQKMNQFVNQAFHSPQRVINQNISSTINIIIQLNKTEDGKYRTTGIEEVSKTLSKDESATIATQSIFEYVPETDSWIENKISDGLTEHFTKKGIDPRTFLPMETGMGEELMEEIPTSEIQAQIQATSKRLRRF